MVSILIPVFGESVDAQLANLASEIKVLDYPVEVIVCDDASPKPLQPAYSDYKGMEFRFIQLPENLGRSRIRNFLGKEAKFEQLIFIDADCQPIHSKFINTYQLNFKPDVVLVGGQLFAEEEPSRIDQKLRWFYGTKVEARPLIERVKAPYKSFMANNFSISKSMLSKYPFDENHTGYGHEDTLFGFQLRKENVNVVHIKNPVRHLGYETNKEFLDKTIEGVHNLVRLYLEGKIDNHVRLIKMYESLRLTGFVGLTRSIMKKRRERYYQELLNGSGKLRKFSLFKMSEFMIELQNQKDLIK
ncbi:MAG: glycosyltransferase family 2 protein [Salibacteraceae bacterium]